MTLDALREICRRFPGATEDVKWGQDLCFSVGGKMFAAVNLERPHQLGFKCTPEMFAELIEREGVIPAPYLARAMWVQETELGASLERRELDALLRASYDLIVEKLPKGKRPGGAAPRPRASGTAKARSSKSAAPKPRRRTKAKPRRRS